MFISGVVVIDHTVPDTALVIRPHVVNFGTVQTGRKCLGDYMTDCRGVPVGRWKRAQ